MLYWLEKKIPQSLCFKFPGFVSGKEGEEEASYFGSLPFLLPRHGPSSYMSAYKGVFQVVPSPILGLASG